jgi:hypothetical protein
MTNKPLNDDCTKYTQQNSTEDKLHPFVILIAALMLNMIFLLIIIELL